MTTDDTNDRQTLDELLDLERQGWRSLCDRSGADFYGRVMTDDALMVLANGQVMTRDDVVGALSEAPPWTEFDLSDVRLVRMGADGAALVYTGSATRAAGDEPFVAAMASAYVREGGSWRLALYQQTPVQAG